MPKKKFAFKRKAKKSPRKEPEKKEEVKTEVDQTMLTGNHLEIKDITGD